MYYTVCVGNIKGAACVTNLMLYTLEILGSCVYNELPSPICDHLAQHLAVATVLLVVYGTKLAETIYWYRPTVTGLSVLEISVHLQQEANRSHIIQCKLIENMDRSVIFNLC